MIFKLQNFWPILHFDSISYIYFYLLVGYFKTTKWSSKRQQEDMDTIPRIRTGSSSATSNSSNQDEQQSLNIKETHSKKQKKWLLKSTD